MRKNRQQWLAIAALMTLTLILAAGSPWAADYRPLIGRWQRTDGGYVIAIKQAAPDGTLQAGYYNPRPINVSRAEASIFKEHIKVELELRDTGYPGSSYTLVYDPDEDVLIGFYYQAVQRQTFDVMFVRLN
jgi:hypothetical protein